MSMLKCNLTGMKKIWMTLTTLILMVPVFGQTPLTKPFEDCQLQGSITLYDY